MTFHILDVFGNAKYTGNQLAVFTDLLELSGNEMQLIAREINFSETTFVLSGERSEGGFPVRIFTPASEIDFAGHPVLGTAFVVNKLYSRDEANTVLLNLKAGQIPVTFDDETLWMKHNQPQFGKTLSVEFVAALLGLEVNDFETNFPIEEVTTGLPFTIVPLKSLTSLQRAKVNQEIYNHFMEITWAKGIMIFCPEGYTPEQDLSTRVFVNYLGIPEDPATGSATGCLAAYLMKHGMFGKELIEMTLGQGYEIGRPSELKIKATMINSEFDIHVGGKVFEIASGLWKI